MPQLQKPLLEQEEELNLRPIFYSLAEKGGVLNGD